MARSYRTTIFSGSNRLAYYTKALVILVGCGLEGRAHTINCHANLNLIQSIITTNNIFLNFLIKQLYKNLRNGALSTTRWRYQSQV
jgi:hypothetical protein